jgi:hypothetical protein
MQLCSRVHSYGGGIRTTAKSDGPKAETGTGVSAPLVKSTLNTWMPVDPET